MITTLTFIRHAQSTAKERGIVQGRGEQESLSALGEEQRQKYVLKCAGWTVDQLFSSASVRAVRTAEPLAQLFPNVLWQKIELLHERSKGVAEGMTKEEFEVKFADIEAAWERGEDPLVPGGETLQAVEERVLPIVQTHLSEYPGQQLVYVIHGNVIRSIIGSILAVPFGLRGRIACDYCSATTVVFDHDRKRFEVKSVNLPLV
jgi:broad specificity phosphatase PhoE